MKKQVIGVLVAVVALAVWKLVIPAIVISTAGWDDARPELVGKLKSGLPPEARAALGTKTDAVVGCVADKAIAFLNTTDCKYKYNQTTTSEAEHLKEQDACLEKVEYVKKEEAYAMECMKQHAPELAAADTP